MEIRKPKPLLLNVHKLKSKQSKKSVLSRQPGVHPDVEIPDCPAHLPAEAKKEYKRVAAELKDLGLISKIDRAALTSYCAAWAEVVRCEKKIAELNAEDPNGCAGLIVITPSGYQQMSVWVQIRNRAYERMMRSLSEFGMSPSSRAKATQSDKHLQSAQKTLAEETWDKM